jgi:hypothetical protein
MTPSDAAAASARMSRSSSEPGDLVAGRGQVGNQPAGRPVDFRRRSELLDAVVDYPVEHRFADLSWRPLAAALGVSGTTLVIATIRGLLLDLLTTGDAGRVQDAAESFLASLESATG